MRHVSIYIDGGHLRSYAKKAKQTYDSALIVKVAKSCINAGENLFRIIYYDSPPYIGTVDNPVSGTTTTFNKPQTLLNNLGEQEYVAVRKGVIKFRGWERTQASLKAHAEAAKNGHPPPALTDADFQPRFEQKGVDLRIGLDMVSNAVTQKNDLMILMTGDTDLIPALKIVRSHGVQVCGVNLPNYKIISELKHHLDIYRSAKW